MISNQSNKNFINIISVHDKDTVISVDANVNKRKKREIPTLITREWRKMRKNEWNKSTFGPTPIKMRLIWFYDWTSSYHLFVITSLRELARRRKAQKKIPRRKCGKKRIEATVQIQRHAFTNKKRRRTKNIRIHHRVIVSRQSTIRNTHIIWIFSLSFSSQLTNNHQHVNESNSTKKARIYFVDMRTLFEEPAMLQRPTRGVSLSTNTKNQVKNIERDTCFCRQQTKSHSNIFHKNIR